jgi:hypothetical protein
MFSQWNIWQIETLENDKQKLEYIVDMYGKECSESRYDLIVIITIHQLYWFLMIMTYASLKLLVIA